MQRRPAIVAVRRETQGRTRMRRFLLGVVAVIALFVVGFAVFVASRQHLKFDAPLPAVTASSDSAVIARGRYVVRDLAHCVGCHGDPSQMQGMPTGEDTPLSGGFVFDIPPGRFYARNLTSDPETGIGSYSDGQVARALRFGVGHDGRALLPFMEMQGLSDEDLVAVVSYLRTQAPVHNAVPMHQYTLLGRIVRATLLANPVGPKETPLHESPHGATIENGRYIAESVANCWACHTQRDYRTGAMIGPHMGGAKMPDDRNPKLTWAPPNLTSDPTTGRLARFSEDGFVERIREGRAYPGSPMPWEGFQKLDEDDLRAIYRYLKTLPPVVNETGPAFVEAK
jgi:mono/diheme cytochrome c family protein